jgi:hypothetical protein
MAGPLFKRRRSILMKKYLLLTAPLRRYPVDSVAEEEASR